MARARRTKRGTATTRPSTATASAHQEHGGRWNGTRVWLAGIVSAVIIAAVGVVFTDWYNARGPDAIGRLAGREPLTVGHVAVHHGLRRLALREPVTDPAERALLLAGAATAQRDAALERHQVAPVAAMNVTVVLVGNRGSLRIVDIEPRVLTRGPASRAALLIPAGAGEVGTVEVTADLDRTAPRFTMAQHPDTAYFSKKQIDLHRDERVTLSMTICAEKAFYTFDLVVTVLAGDRTEQVAVTGPGGRPFRLTGPASTYRSSYQESPAGGWRPQPKERIRPDASDQGC